MTPDPQFKFVKLLVPFNDGTFNDVSTSVLTPSTTGTVTIDSSVKKYGANSCLFSAGSLTFTSPTFVAVANTNCTFECWFRTTALGTEQYVFDTREVGDGGIAISISATGQLTYVIAGSGTVATATTTAVLVAVNSWYHVRIRRVLVSATSYTTDVFLNGTFATSLSNSLTPGLPATIMSSSLVTIGARYDSTLNFVGNIDEVRFTIGHSRGSASTSNKIAIPVNSFPTIGTNTIGAILEPAIKFNAVNTGIPTLVPPLIGQPQYRISGTIQVNGATTTSLKIVSLYRQSNKVCLQQISATDSYVFFGLNPAEKYSVVVTDLTGNMRAVIQDNLYPTLNYTVPV